MIECFLLSVAGGLIVGMPVGVAGAMVADSALQRIRKRTVATVVAAGMGDLTLACMAGFFSSHLVKLIYHHEAVVSYLISSLLVCVGLTLFMKAWRHRVRQEFTTQDVVEHRAEGYILRHFGPALAVYLLTVLHPANFLFVAGIAGGVRGNLPESFNTWIFAIGLGCGSMFIFSFSAFLFWKIGKRAGRFVYAMRFALASLIVVIGIVLFFLPLNFEENFVEDTFEHHGGSLENHFTP